MQRNFDYMIDEQGYIKILGLPYKTRYVEIPREKNLRKLYSYILIDIDLEYVMKYLEICKQSDSPVVKEGLFKMAVVQYAKCFSPSKRGGRSNINENRVYRDIPNDPIGCHQKFIEMRKKYFAHDEGDYSKAQIGALLNMDDKVYVGCLPIRKQAKFDYDESIDILMILCKVARNWIQKEIEIANQLVGDYLRELDFEVLDSYPDLKVY